MYSKTGKRLPQFNHASIKAKEVGFDYVLSNDLKAKMPKYKTVIFATGELFFNAYGDLIEKL